MRFSAFALMCALMLGCGDDDAGCDVDSDCSDGDWCVNGACVEARDGGAGVDARGRGDAESQDAETPDAIDAGATGGLVPAERPSPPPTPAIVETVTIAVETADGEFAGTSDPTQVCLDETCITMTQDGAPMTLRPWRIHVQHETGLGIAGDSIERIRLVSGGENQFEPACVDVRFDGVPVHCGRLEDVFLSTDPGDENGVPSWQGPLANTCVSCAGSTLPYGPVLGMPGPSSISVWLRGDATRLYGLELSRDPTGADAVTVAYQYALPSSDYTIRFDVTDLAEDSAYYYRVTVDDEPHGDFLPARTAPAPMAAVRIGVGSCSRANIADHREQHEKTFGHLSALDLDAFLFVGDSHYANAQTLDLHRDFLRDSLRIDARAALLARVPMAATWDDHDFLGNNTDGECAGRDNALQAVREYWPNPAFGVPAAEGTFFRQRLGAAELIVLDCRSFRPRLANADGTNADDGRRCENSGDIITDVEHGPLGSVQHEWLQSALEDSTAPFKIIACGSLMTSNGIDSWQSFPEARDALYDSIHARGIDGVVFVSGDIHRSHARVLPRTDGYDFYEFVSSPLAQYSRALNARTQCDTALGVTTNGTEVLYCDPYNSFLELRVRPDELSAVFYDEDGRQRYAMVLSLADLTTP